MEDILNWVSQYGYYALFVLLAFGVVGMPVPDEALLLFVGFLCWQDRMDLPLSLAVAFGSSICGVSVTYLLGRTLGRPLVGRYGWIVRITPHRLERVNQWFARYGRWTLASGYFVPGLRQAVPYAAGMTGTGIWTFCLCAFSGGLVWASVFVILGYILGPQWRAVFLWFQKGRVAVIALIAAVILLYLAIRVGAGRGRREQSGSYR
jgi:membrane protein DedA with SNARE-associated domain